VNNLPSELSKVKPLTFEDFYRKPDPFCAVLKRFSSSFTLIFHGSAALNYSETGRGCGTGLPTMTTPTRGFWNAYARWRRRSAMGIDSRIVAELLYPERQRARTPLVALPESGRAEPGERHNFYSVHVWWEYGAQICALLFLGGPKNADAQDMERGLPLPGLPDLRRS